MRQKYFLLLAVLLCLASCTSQKEQADMHQTVYNEEQRLPGDSTIYGFACEGCTDSVVVYLPFTGGDPDTIDILRGRMGKKVFGRPAIGDQLAIILNPDNQSHAEMIINLEELKGEWCYQVVPHWRHHATAAPGEMTQQRPNIPDTIRERLFVPREYGIEIRREYIARPIGHMAREAAEAQSPVEYPPIKQYREWRIFNGHLILNETRRDTLGTSQVISSDTADIVLLHRDTLVLRIGDTEQGYYRRKEK